MLDCDWSSDVCSSDLFYSAVDVRNAGFKLAPVATNLFPGAFDNLTPEMLPLAVQAAMAAIEKICPEAKNLLLIPDHERRNPSYLFSVRRLMQIFHQAGLNVRLGSLDASLGSPTPVVLPDGDALVLEPLLRRRGRLGLKGFDPCTILLNTDLPHGPPKVVQHLYEQYLLPPLHAGRAVRRKSNHFCSYEEVAKKFAKLLGMDPWLINPMFTACGPLDLAQGAARDALKQHAEALLVKVRRKHKEYGIAEKPYVVLKTDNGSEGLGVATVRDARDIDGWLAARATGPASAGETALIVQEGVPTHRSEERRVGKECRRLCRSRWSPYH
jgi:glutamate--cysteine ligase